MYTLHEHLVKWAISCTVRVPAMAVMSSRFPLNLKPINLKQTAETWNIRIAFLSVIPTRRHLINLIIHAIVHPQFVMATQRYTMAIILLARQNFSNKHMLHGSLTEHRIFSLISYLASSLWLILYHSPPIFFLFQSLTIIQSVQWLGLEPASRDSIPGKDTIFIFHKASIHCDEVIAIARTQFFSFSQKSLKDLHEAWTNKNTLILQWTWLIAFISTCLDNGIKLLWKQGVCLGRMDLATWLHSATQHNASYLISLKRPRNKCHIGSELKIIVHPCPLWTTKPLTSRKSVTAVLINK